MKTVTGRVISTEPISLSKAATLLSGFVSSENGATQAFSAYLRRASDAFNELKSLHREIKSSSRKEKKTNSDARRDQNPAGEPEEKVRFKESEKVSTLGQEQEVMKKDKKKKKKSEVVVDGKVKEKLEDEERNEERKDKKKKKRKKKYEEVGSEEKKSKKKRKN